VDAASIGTMGASAGSAAAAQQAIANAVKANGVLVTMERHEFELLLARLSEPLVVCASKSGFFGGSKHKYLTSYKGLAFYLSTDSPIVLPPDAQVIAAKSVSIPG